VRCSRLSCGCSSRPNRTNRFRSSCFNEYLTQQDWRVNANANQGYSLGGLILNVSGKVTANYWLSHVYRPRSARRTAGRPAHPRPRHAGRLLRGLVAAHPAARRLNGVPGKVEAGPPQAHVQRVGQIVNFLGTLQNEWAGAQAFSPSTPTWRPTCARRLGYEAVRQCIQELIYNLNVPSRWGTQTPFTNLTFDWTCPEDLREQVPVIGGVEMPFTYGDLQAEMDLINRAYIDVMMHRATPRAGCSPSPSPPTTSPGLRLGPARTPSACSR
jgi:anaerobic ribonucleoside-triphosphate reductase